MAFIPQYILILFLLILIDYVAGIWIEQAEGHKRKWFLVISLVSNIGMLAFFKYYNFFAENLRLVFPHIPFLDIILPIGLSFHTFQAMSYTIEVYRGNQKAERHLGIYALYVMFFPQLVAGPIERPQNVLHQYHERKYFDYDNVTGGLKLMLWGLFKKVVVADRLADISDMVFNDPHRHSPLSLLIGTLFFTFQIYCDFSGYSDIAIGSARVMGFTLMKNFDTPYESRTIAEFWKRWHISLSTWFRDYLYIPLGGNRVSVPRWYFNLFFVFIVSGFWHGANWTFLIWGALHGFYLVFGIATGRWRKGVMDILGIPPRKALYDFIQVLSTFSLVAFAWIFFRSNSLGDALYISKGLLHLPGDIVRILTTRKLDISIVNEAGVLQVFLSVALIALLLTAEYLNRRYRMTILLKSYPALYRWGLYYLLMIVVVSMAVYSKRYFIYFQF